LLLQGNNGYANDPQRYVILTLPSLLVLVSYIILYMPTYFAVIGQSLVKLNMLILMEYEKQILAIHVNIYAVQNMQSKISS
jgi:hypothetical protein